MYSPLNDTYTTHTSLNTQIFENPMLTSVNLSALKEAENVVVRLTLSFVFLFLVFCVFFHNKSYHSSAACEIHSLTLLPYKTSIQQTKQQIRSNPELQTLSAPNLVDGGSVCIGDDINQPSLDADLSSLVTGSFAGFFPCYGGTNPPTNQLNAEKVCGVDGGLFTTAGCPSMACPTPPPPS